MVEKTVNKENELGELQLKYERLKKELNDKKKLMEENRNKNANLTNVNRQLKQMIVAVMKQKEKPN